MSVADSNEPVFYIADDLIMAPDWLGRALSFLDKHGPPSSKGEGRNRCLGVNLYTDFRTQAMGYPHEAYDADGERVPWIDGAFLTPGFVDTISIARTCGYKLAALSTEGIRRLGPNK